MSNNDGVMAEEHLVQPPQQFDQRALEMYQLLRSVNPWLPEPGRVMANANIELSWGPFQQATLSMTMGIELPVGFQEVMDQ